MFTISDDLIVYGGDKSGLAVCTMSGADWKWAAPTIAGRCTAGQVASCAVCLVPCLPSTASQLHHVT